MEYSREDIKKIVEANFILEQSEAIERITDSVWKEIIKEYDNADDYQWKNGESDTRPEWAKEN